MKLTPILRELERSPLRFLVPPRSRDFFQTHPPALAMRAALWLPIFENRVTLTRDEAFDKSVLDRINVFERVTCFLESFHCFVPRTQRYSDVREKVWPLLLIRRKGKIVKRKKA